MPKTTTLIIDGMSCGSCVRHVEQALRRVPGVVSARVDLAARTAVVAHDGATTPADLAAAVSGAGYAVASAA